MSSSNQYRVVSFFSDDIEPVPVFQISVNISSIRQLKPFNNIKNQFYLKTCSWSKMFKVNVNVPISISTSAASLR
jgi:hypothetical protein